MSCVLALHELLALLRVLLLLEVLVPLLSLLLLLIGGYLLAMIASLLLLPGLLLWWLVLLPAAWMLVLPLQAACTMQVLLLCVLTGRHTRLVASPIRLLLHLPLLLLLLHGVAAWNLLHAWKALLCCFLPAVLVLSLLMLPLPVLL